MGMKARRIPIDPIPQNTPYPREPGQFRYETMDHVACEPPSDDQPFRLNFGCPMGHGNCGSVIIGRTKPAMKPSWQWDGNVDNPTLHPSINCLACNPNNPNEKFGGCGWHAWLTAGVFG